MKAGGTLLPIKVHLNTQRTIYNDAADSRPQEALEEGQVQRSSSAYFLTEREGTAGALSVDGFLDHGGCGAQSSYSSPQARGGVAELWEPG